MVPSIVSSPKSEVTEVALDEGGSATLSITLDAHWSGGCSRIGTARVTGIRSFEEAQAFFAALATPTDRYPWRVLDVRVDGSEVFLALEVDGGEPPSPGFLGAPPKEE